MSDFPITPEMIAAGEQAASDMHTADAVSAFGNSGMGGCMKRDEAPDHIRRYLDRKEPSAKLLFEAMDALSPCPFGEPSVLMVAHGVESLTSMTEALFADAALSRDPDISVHDSVKPYLGRTESSVAVMYRDMRQFGERELKNQKQNAQASSPSGPEIG